MAGRSKSKRRISTITGKPVDPPKDDKVLDQLKDYDVTWLGEPAPEIAPSAIGAAFSRLTRMFRR